MQIDKLLDHQIQQNVIVMLELNVLPQSVNPFLTTFSSKSPIPSTVATNNISLQDHYHNWTVITQPLKCKHSFFCSHVTMIRIYPPALCSFTRSYVSIWRRNFPGEGSRNILMGEHRQWGVYAHWGKLGITVSHGGCKQSKADGCIFKII